LRGRNEDLFRKAAKLALIVGVPISALNLWWGSHLGIVITEYQPMKIASTEAQWDTCQPCGFSLFQIGGFTEQDQTPSFDIVIPKLLSFLATGSFNGEVQGITPLQQQSEREFGPGNYKPPIETTYWAMRTMAYLGSLVFLVFAVAAFFSWRGTFEPKRWLLWAGVFTIPLPFIAALAGWVLTESGRQPWIVWGLLQTANANSPSVSTATIVLSLVVFGLLYLILTVLNFVLLRRYARFDPPEVGGEGDEFSVPAVAY
jgi:cytochrome d ubiquinol oxidase subunit I